MVPQLLLPASLTGVCGILLPGILYQQRLITSLAVIRLAVQLLALHMPQKQQMWVPMDRHAGSAG